MAFLSPIETEYAGYRFRSRLEARWAVFFGALGLKWDYEPDAYKLPGGSYLPDFFVRIQDGADRGEGADWETPVPGYWVEVKGAPPTVLDIRLLHELQNATGHRAVLVWGLPDSREWWETFYSCKEAIKRPDGARATAFFWNCLRRPEGCGTYGETMVYLHSRMQFAVKSAKSARFENGRAEVSPWA